MPTDEHASLLQFADGQDRCPPWAVHPVPSKTGVPRENPQVELVGVSAKTPWEITERDNDGPSRRRAPVAQTEGQEAGEAPEPQPKRAKTLTDEEDEEIRKAVLAVRKARALKERKRAATGREDEWELPAAPGKTAEPRWSNGRDPGARDDPREICMRNYDAIGAGDTAADERVEPAVAVAATKGGKRGKAPVRCYGLIDQGVARGGVRCLTMHAPAPSTATDTATDRVRPGSVLRVHSTAVNGGPGRLRVRFTTPDRYYAPGARVSTLRIGVDASDWACLTPGV